MVSLSPKLNVKIAARLQRPGYLLESLVRSLSQARLTCSRSSANTTRASSTSACAHFSQLMGSTIPTSHPVDGASRSPATDIDAFVRYAEWPADDDWVSRINLHDGELPLPGVKRYKCQ